MPQPILTKWRAELAVEANIDLDAALRRRVETYLDQGYGQCYLRHSALAQLVQSSLLFFDGERYKLSAWVVMPNHVHALLTPLVGHQLSQILHSLKSYTATKANKILSTGGRFWQPESFDRYIRDSKHFPRWLGMLRIIPLKPDCARGLKIGHTAAPTFAHDCQQHKS